MKPTTPDRASIHAALDDILDSGQLTNGGKYVQEFERELAALHGVKHAICLCNATTGLMIAAAMLPRGEVIMPSFSFVATASAFAFMGHKPVFCDIGPDHNIDAELIQELVTHKTVAVVGVHLWGHLCNVGKIESIGRLNYIKTIYDAAHAFGQHSPGLSVYSLHATKAVHSFEGGYITTDNDQEAEQIRLMINFGLASRHDCQMVGINGKMSEIHAAAGLSNLRSYPAILERNKRNFEIYRERLPVMAGPNYHYIVLDCGTKEKAQEIAEATGALRYFTPAIHQIECYPDAHLPNTEAMSGRLVVLPNDRCEEVVSMILDII